MFSSIRMIFAVLLITGIAGAGMYVMKLRADNATLKANQIELEKMAAASKALGRPNATKEIVDQIFQVAA